MDKRIISLATSLYRVSEGRLGGKMCGGDVLLLTTTGRKTGKQRTLPLIYFMDGFGIRAHSINWWCTEASRLVFQFAW